MTSTPESTCASRWCPSPNFEPRRAGRRADLLLLHYTGMTSAQAALDWLTRAESRVSAHYLVDEDGHVTQMVAEEMRAWHAGHAHWAGEDDINSCSIGIEVHNPGPECGYPDFPEAQMAAVEALCADILSRHPIPPARVLAHSDVAPARKCDPGEKFDWKRLARAGVGLWVKPTPPEGDAGWDEGEEGPEVAALQASLARFGYRLEPSGVYDRATALAVSAFQRHFRPALIDGLADRSTRETLARLIERL